MTAAPVTYQVSLEDLIDIADAAADLDAMKQFYVDQPDMQQQIGARARRLHDIVDRAAAGDVVGIYRNA